MATVVAAMTMMSACNNGAPKPGLKTSADTLSYELGMANSVDEEQLKMYLADPRTGSDSTYIKEFMKGFNEGLEAATDKKKGCLFGRFAGRCSDERQHQASRRHGVRWRLNEAPQHKGFRRWLQRWYLR